MWSSVSSVGRGVSDADLADDAKSLKSLIPASEYV